jgi:hypothetical protein
LIDIARDRTSEPIALLLQIAERVGAASIHTLQASGLALHCTVVMLTVVFNALAHAAATVVVAPMFPVAVVLIDQLHVVCGDQALGG